MSPGLKGVTRCRVGRKPWLGPVCRPTAGPLLLQPLGVHSLRSDSGGVHTHRTVRATRRSVVPARGGRVTRCR